MKVLPIQQQIYDGENHSESVEFYDITADEGMVLVFRGEIMGTHVITETLEGWGEQEIPSDDEEIIEEESEPLPSEEAEVED